jgi:hypothetical protein
MILRSLLIILLSVLAACSRSLVSIDYDPATAKPVAGATSYALSDPASGPEFQSLDNNRIAAALRKQLAARGLKEAPREQADLWVAYRVDSERKLDNSGVSFGVGFGTGNLGMGVSTGPQAKEIREGRLVVDMVDPKRQQVVWTAKANEYLKESMRPEQRDALVNKLVAEMLANFPPKGDK